MTDAEIFTDAKITTAIFSRPGHFSTARKHSERCPPLQAVHTDPHVTVSTPNPTHPFPYKDPIVCRYVKRGTVKWGGGGQNLLLSQATGPPTESLLCNPCHAMNLRLVCPICGGRVTGLRNGRPIRLLTDLIAGWTARTTRRVWRSRGQDMK